MKSLGAVKAGLRLVGAPGVAVVFGLEECAMAGKIMLDSHYTFREYSICSNSDPHCVGGLVARGTVEKSGLKSLQVPGHFVVVQETRRTLSTKTCQMAEQHCPEAIRHACEGTCWNCGKTPENYFMCGNCGIIQPPDKKVDAFKIFD